MKCIIFLIFGYFLVPCLTFKPSVNKTLQYTKLENIVKTGIRRFIDNYPENVLKQCKRPLVFVSDLDSDFDLHTRVGKTLSEILNLNIDDVNNSLRDEIKKDLSIIRSCQISHDTLKIQLTDEYLLEELDGMYNDERLAVGKLTDEKVVVDYFSPNVGKMLHMGHIRSLVIGDSLANLLEFSGSEVYRRNHVGDFGLQCGILMRYIMEYDMRMMEALDIKKLTYDRAMYEERYKRGYEMPTMRLDYRERNLHLPLPEFVDKLIFTTIDSYYKLACDKFKEDVEFAKRARYEAMLLQNSKSLGQTQWNKIRESCIAHYKDFLEFYYIKGLKTIPESCYKNIAEKLIKNLIEQGTAKEEGKKVLLNIPDLDDPKENQEDDQIDFYPGYQSHFNDENDFGLSNQEEEEEDMDTLDGEEGSPEVESKNSDSLNKSVLRTSDGCLTYMATDLAALSHRVEWHNPDRIIYVTENSQKPHFKKLYKISKRLKLLKECRMEHIGFGQVTLEGLGKLRSRSGSKCSLVDITRQVLNLVGDEIVKRGDYTGEKKPVLSRKIGVGSMIFSDLSVERESGYQFSMERLMNQGNNGLIAILYSYVRSLSIQNKAENLEVVENREFRNTSERSLGVTLLGFENSILSALAMREPHRICKYLRNLSKDFNRFYKDTHVIDHNKVYSQSLKLVKLTSRVIERALKILSIQTIKHL